MGGGKGGSGDQTVGYEYYLGMHFILCHGVIDSVTAIDFDEKEAFKGEAYNSTIVINQRSLFGGEAREGGVAGNVDIVMGNSTQTQNAYLLGQLGATLPSFRGVVSAIFNSFYVGNNPYLKKVRFRCSRVHNRKTVSDQWYDSKAGVNEVNKLSIDGAVFDTIAGFQGQQANNFYITNHNFSPDGLSCIVGNVNGWIWQLNLATAFDMATASWDGLGYNLTVLTGNVNFHQINEVKWTNDGAKFSVNYTRQFVGYLGVWSLSGNYDLTSTKTLEDEYTDATHKTRRKVFSSDGLKCWAFDAVTLGEYTLNTAWDMALTNLTFIKSVPRGITNAYGSSLAWSANGKTFYISYSNNATNERSIRGFLVSTPYDISGLDLSTTVQIVYDFSYDTKPNWTVAANDLTLDESSGHIILSTTFAGATSDSLGQLILSFSYYTGDLNPAHIIRECLTDPDWGMGYAESNIDDVSFMAAADTMFTEGMGISMLWSREMPIEKFVTEIIRHIDAVLFVDRPTGKFALNLIRADFVVASIPTLDETNIIKVEDAKRPAFGELVNAITINYYDLEFDEVRTVSVQDIAAVQRVGETIGTTIDYSGFTNPTIATKVAQRDLAGLSKPLLAMVITANRSAASLNIGEAINVNWPELKINKVFRVTGLSLGEAQRNEVRLTVVEDAFGLPAKAIVTSDNPEWTPVITTPVPMINEYFSEVPYLELVRIFRQIDADNELSSNPDFAQIGCSGDNPASGTLNAGIYSDDGAGFVRNGSVYFCPYAVVAAAISYTDTAITISGLVGISNIRLGSYAVINNEFVVVSAITATTATIARAILDTLPAQHAINDKIFFIEDNWDLVTQEFASGEMIEVRLAPSTGSAAIDFTTVTGTVVTLNQRAIRPYNAGNMKVNALYYPASIGLLDELQLTWAHRNRLQQTATVHTEFTDPDVTPETGLTYTLRIYGQTDTLLRTVSGMTGTSYTYLSADELTDSGLAQLSTSLRFEFESVVSARVSTQIYNHTVTRI